MATAADSSLTGVKPMMLTLEALAWEQDKIRHKATLWQWLLTWPEEKVDELRAWLDKQEASNVK